MLGYDISWAAFNIIEVMSSSKFTFKVELVLLYVDVLYWETHSLNVAINCRRSNTVFNFASIHMMLGEFCSVVML